MDKNKFTALVWVAAISGCYGYEGKYYGPSSEPTQVPFGLAQSLGLDEIEEPEATEPPTVVTGGKPSVETSSLETELATAKTALATKEIELSDAQAKLSTEMTARAAAETAKASLETELATAKTALETAQPAAEDHKRLVDWFLNPENSVSIQDGGVAENVIRLLETKPAPATPLPTIEELEKLPKVSKDAAKVVLEFLASKANPPK